MDIDFTSQMDNLTAAWDMFEKYADEHNAKQPGYPGYFENGIAKDMREFIRYIRRVKLEIS